MAKAEDRQSGLTLEGEGSREGSRRYQEAQRKFAESGDVEKKAKEAARAIEGDDAEELEQARKASTKGETA